MLENGPKHPIYWEASACTMVHEPYMLQSGNHLEVIIPPLMILLLCWVF